MEKVKIDEIELVLSHPDQQKRSWIGQEELMEQILACWLTVAADDLPLCPRLVGKPGMGKTTLAMAAGARLGKPVYIYQCTMDTRPEDLIITPVLSESGKIQYHASSLVTAAIKGGVAVLDEANRMSEKSWASLAPLLDHRRYVESIVAGVKIQAHPDFRCCVTMNDDASTYEIPDYIISRLQPMIQLEFPEREEEMAILRYNLPFAPEEILNLTLDFLQRSHEARLDYSIRDGLSIARYALKIRAYSPKERKRPWKDTFQKAVEQTLGKDALDIKKRSSQINRQNLTNLAFLEDFFTSEKDWMDGSEENE
ncbi:MAG: AAA family ATPase [bacterium]|nr:AAA family ATPase [bacterium]